MEGLSLFDTATVLSAIWSTDPQLQYLRTWQCLLVLGKNNIKNVSENYNINVGQLWLLELRTLEELLCQHHSCQAHTPCALLSPSHRSSQTPPALLELCVWSNRTVQVCVSDDSMRLVQVANIISELKCTNLLQRECGSVQHHQHQSHISSLPQQCLCKSTRSHLTDKNICIYKCPGNGTLRL